MMINARVFNLTAAGSCTALNQRDKVQGHRKNLVTEVEIEEQSQNLEVAGTENFQRQETTGDISVTLRRLEDLGTDQTFGQIDGDRSKLTIADEPRSCSNNKQSVVQPLSVANLSLLDHSRTGEQRSTSLEYAKLWLDNAVQCYTPPGEVETISSCEENNLNEDTGFMGTLQPQEAFDAGNKPCSSDVEVLPVFAVDKSERSYPKRIGMMELNNECNPCDTNSSINRSSKARSRDLLAGSALGIPVAMPPTQLQIYPDDEKLVRSKSLELIRVSLSRKLWPDKDGQRTLPEQSSHKQNHDSISESRESSTKQKTTDGNISQRNGSLSSSAAIRGEMETYTSSSSGLLTERTTRPGIPSTIHISHIADKSFADLIGFPVAGESARMTTSEWRRDISPPVCVATDEKDTTDENESGKPRDSVAKHNQQQRKISAGLVQPNEFLPRQKISAVSNSEPSDSKLFHEMTLEWSPGEGNLLATKTPEQCCICSRTAQLPDIPSLKYYKLSHQCSRSSLQHSASTSAHSVSLINSQSEQSLQELRDLSRLATQRQNSSAPVQGCSRRSLSAVEATTTGNHRPIFSGSPNASDPCLWAATLLWNSHHKPAPPVPSTLYGADALCIRLQPPRRDAQDLPTKSDICDEFKLTSPNRGTTSSARSREKDSIPKLQTPGLTSALRISDRNATQQNSMKYTHVKPEQKTPEIMQEMKLTQTTANKQSTVHQTPHSVIFPSTSLPTGRVKYRKISQQISDLMPNYDVSAFASKSYPNQDKV